MTIEKNEEIAVPEQEKSWVVDVGDADFETAVLKRSHEIPVVVDFWAEWCGPCRILGPTLEKLAQEAGGGFLLAKVDVDTAQQTAQAFGIQSIPTVVAFKDGVPVSQFAGAIPEPAAREFIQRLVPSETEELVRRAEAKREESAAEAEPIYRKALELEPGYDAAKVGLAELLLARGETEEAGRIVDGLVLSGALGERLEQVRAALMLAERSSTASEDELRARLEEDPGNAQTLLELGELLASEKKYEDALPTLLEAATHDRTLASGRVKDLMVEIFHVIGIRSETADAYREKLSRLLY